MLQNTAHELHGNHHELKTCIFLEMTDFVSLSSRRIESQRTVAITTMTFNALALKELFSLPNYPYQVIYGILFNA